jgi:hypothetical protein
MTDNKVTALVFSLKSLLAFSFLYLTKQPMPVTINGTALKPLFSRFLGV